MIFYIVQLDVIKSHIHETFHPDSPEWFYFIFQATTCRIIYICTYKCDRKKKLNGIIEANL